MATLEIDVLLEWCEMPIDLSYCDLCNDLIAGKMFELFVFVDDKPEGLIKSCSSCYYMIGIVTNGR